MVMATSDAYIEPHRRSWVAPVVLGVIVVFAAAVILLALASSGNYGGQGMMGGWSGWWWFAAIMMLVPFVVILFLLLALDRPLPPAQAVAPRAGEDPMTILKQRYARGELSSEQYDQMLQRIGGR